MSGRVREESRGYTCTVYVGSGKKIFRQYAKIAIFVKNTKMGIFANMQR